MTFFGSDPDRDDLIGSGAGKKVRIWLDPDSQHCIVLPLSLLLAGGLPEVEVELIAPYSAQVKQLKVIKGLSHQIQGKAK